jgi:hypothetical protein
MRANPVAALKPIKVPPSPTLPFDEDQMDAILKSCDRYSINGIYGEQNATRLRALTLLIRSSGLSIGDAVTCARDRLIGSKLFLYQAKHLRRVSMRSILFGNGAARTIGKR